MDRNRISLFENTKKVYLEELEEGDELIIVSRSIFQVEYPYFKVLNYVWDQEGFSQALPLNLGVLAAKNEHIVVTSPEVIPAPGTIKLLKELEGFNVVCQVFAQNEDGSKGMSLVNHEFRSNSPAMHFLAMFNKSDLEKINGWSLDYMRGSGAYDDDDFGDRFNKAGLKFEMMDSLTALHQWHPINAVNKEWLENMAIYEKQAASNNFWAERGLRET